MEGMKTSKRLSVVLAVALSGELTAFIPSAAYAHCDTMAGPVISAARQALDTGNVNLVFVWVQPKDEGAIREEFEKARTGRQAGGQAKEAAEMRFFEALVRIHRTGEGAPYTGIKPADTDVGPAVAAADQALASGTVEPVRAVVVNAVQAGIEKHFRAVSELKSYNPDDVAAGRAYVGAYVRYTHFAEGLYEKATAVAAHHEHGEAESHGAEHGAAHEGHDGHEGHLPWILAGLLGLALIAETGWILTRKRKT